MTELKYCVVDENGVVRSKVQSLQVPDISLGQCLIDGLDSDLSRLVLIDQPSGRTWNAAQTKEAELKIATALVKLDLGSGKFVCAYLPNNDLHALWQCGVYMAASVYVGCHNSSSQRELLHEVEVTKSEAILCSIDNLQLVAKVADDVQSVKCVIVVDNDRISPKNATEGGKPIHSSYELLKLAPEEVLKAPVPISGDPKTTPAAIIFTSGSTGMPKGAIRSHTNTIAPLCGRKGQSLALMGGHSSIAHISGTSFVAAAHVNVAFVLNNYFEVQSFLEGVEKYKINVGFVTPTRLLDLLNSKLYEQYDLSSMKMLFCGGSPLPDTIKEPATKALGIAGINQTYASTECGAVCNLPPMVVDSDSIGVPGPGYEVKIVDRETGLTLGMGEVGEAYVRGPSVTIGYLNDPKETAKAITEDGFFKTGDAMYYDTNGMFFIVDRYKEIIKVHTSPVAPAELESMLIENDEVAEAAVIGVPDEQYGQVPRAYVVLKAGISGDETLRQKLVNYIKENGAEWKQLRGGVVFVDHLAKISIGKIDRKRLKQLAAEEA